MTTLHEAYDALIRLANNEGRAGRKLYGYAVIHPTTATEPYSIAIDCRPMESATERWSA